MPTPENDDRRPRPLRRGGALQGLVVAVPRRVRLLVGAGFALLAGLLIRDLAGALAALAGRGTWGTALLTSVAPGGFRSARRAAGDFVSDDGLLDLRGVPMDGVLGRVGDRVRAVHVALPGGGDLLTDDPLREVAWRGVVVLLCLALAVASLTLAAIVTVPQGPAGIREVARRQRVHHAGWVRWLLPGRGRSWSWLARRWLDVTGAFTRTAISFSWLTVLGGALFGSGIAGASPPLIAAGLALILYDVPATSLAQRRNRRPLTGWVAPLTDDPVSKVEVGTPQPDGVWTWGLTGDALPAVSFPQHGSDPYRFTYASGRLPRWLARRALRAALRRDGADLPAQASWRELWDAVPGGG